MVAGALYSSFSLTCSRCRDAYTAPKVLLQRSRDVEDVARTEDTVERGRAQLLDGEPRAIRVLARLLVRKGPPLATRVGGRPDLPALGAVQVQNEYVAVVGVRWRLSHGWNRCMSLAGVKLV